MQKVQWLIRHAKIITAAVAVAQCSLSSRSGKSIRTFQTDNTTIQECLIDYYELSQKKH